jgi:glycerol kinase
MELTGRLRDQMNIIEESSDMEMLVGSVKDTGGVYFVTAFSGLLAPYWDRDAVSAILNCSRFTLTYRLGQSLV